MAQLDLAMLGWVYDLVSPCFDKNSEAPRLQGSKYKAREVPARQVRPKCRCNLVDASARAGKSGPAAGPGFLDVYPRSRRADRGGEEHLGGAGRKEIT